MTVQKWYVLGGFGYHGNLLVFFCFWFLVCRVSNFVHRYSRSGLECAANGMTRTAGLIWLLQEAKSPSLDGVADGMTRSAAMTRRSQEAKYPSLDNTGSKNSLA